MVGRELHAEAPLAVDDHAVPVALRDHGSSEHSRPERALGSEVRGVEHEDLSTYLHGCILSSAVRFGAER